MTKEWETVRVEGTGKELGAEEGEVVMDGENLGFIVKMVNGTHLHAACGNAEGRVLNSLEFLNLGWELGRYWGTR